MSHSYLSGEQTKQRILDVTTDLFYQNGFVTTTYDQICEHAHVNRALISYHFKNKKNLGMTVYNNVWAKVSRACWKIAGGQAIEMQLCIYIFAYYRILLNPHYTRFLSEMNHEQSYNPMMIENEKVFFRPIIHKYRHLTDRELEILAQMDFGIEKEIVQMALKTPLIDAIDQMTSMELRMILNYADYPTDEIQHMIQYAIQYLSNYSIRMVHHFDISIENKDLYEPMI